MVTLKLKKSISILLLSCTVNVVFAITGCPAEFSESCKCGRILMGPYVTNCTNSGFKAATMLQELPLETEVLIFVGNKVTDLPTNIFSLDATYDNLHTIDFSDNKIQTIKGKTFHKVENVKKLILNDNDIYIVSKDHHPRMFSNFENLEELYLRNAFTKNLKSEEYLDNLAEIFENSTLNNLKILDMGKNGITRLPFNEFCSLPSLEELNLADNHLTDININFTCLTNLKKLDLSNNNIISLSHQALMNIQELKYLSLNLANNPFKCDCDMLETYEWMQDTKLYLVNRSSFRCSDRFAANRGKLLFSVPKEAYMCVNSVHHIILAFGIIILIVVVVLLLHKNRKQVNVFVGRFIQPIRNKFQYVSLERRDNTLDV